MSQRTQRLRKHLYIIRSVLNQDHWTHDDMGKMLHSVGKALDIANEIHKEETYTIADYCDELQKQEDEAREYFDDMRAQANQPEFIYNSGVNIDSFGHIIP